MKDPKNLSNLEKANILRKYGKKTKEQSTSQIVERACRLILQQEPAEIGTVWVADVAMKSDFLRFEWDSCEISKIPCTAEDHTLIDMVRDTTDQAGMCSVIDVLRPEMTADIVHCLFIGVGRGYPVFGCQMEDAYIRVRRVDDDLPEYDSDRDEAANAAIDEMARLFDREYAEGRIPTTYFDEKSGFNRMLDEMGLGHLSGLFGGSSGCGGDCEHCGCSEGEDGETDEPEVEGGDPKALPAAEGEQHEDGESVGSNLNPSSEEKGDQE